jgi:hypothetical protein
MMLQFSDVHRRAVFDARVVSRRAHGWVLQRWPMFVCAVLGIAARAGSASVPMAGVELVLAAASVSATLVLVDAWARDADDIRRASARAIAAATWCALVATVGS